MSYASNLTSCVSPTPGARHSDLIILDSEKKEYASLEQYLMETTHLAWILRVARDKYHRIRSRTT